jgi:DNA repair protein RecO (recombination protein O)
MAYFQSETRELVNLDSCELIQSQFGLASDYRASVALDFLAEVSDQLLPSAEPGEKFFRLLVAVLEALRNDTAAGPWCAVTYFSYWAARLSGWLPELDVCLGCGSALDDPEAPERAFFSRGQPGLVCGHCRAAVGAGGAWELSAESRATAREMARRPLAEVAAAGWTQAKAADLRRFLVSQIEAHVERKLITVSLLEAG